MKARNRKHTLNLTRQSSHQLVYGSLSLVNGILMAALIATRTANTWAGRIPTPAGKAEEILSLAG